MAGARDCRLTLSIAVVVVNLGSLINAMLAVPRSFIHSLALSPLYALRGVLTVHPVSQSVGGGNSFVRFVVTLRNGFCFQH